MCAVCQTEYLMDNNRINVTKYRGIKMAAAGRKKHKRGIKNRFRFEGNVFVWLLEKDLGMTEYTFWFLGYIKSIVIKYEYSKEINWILFLQCKHAINAICAFFSPLSNSHWCWWGPHLPHVHICGFHTNMQSVLFVSIIKDSTDNQVPHILLKPMFVIGWECPQRFITW